MVGGKIMRKMNKGLSILISALMIFSSVSFVGFSADYENHWAKDAISSLLSSGVISGDTDGSIRPDDNILRAEYVKVINRYFEYEDASNENFNDVDSSKWYYNEFAIAKNAGYITGDANGNANPEAYITRAEVCVILSRILKLEENTSVDFADSENIPDWAKGYIGAMVKEGLISGYDDGTVKAENNITRAEAFSVVSKTTASVKQEPITNTEVTNNGNTSSMVVVKPSSGGGGGGGGGSRPEPEGNTDGDTSSTVASITLDSFAQVDYSVQLRTANADSITVKIDIKDDSFSREFTFTNQPVDNVFVAKFEDNLRAIVAERLKDDDIFILSVKANGKSGYSDSSYINIAEFTCDLMKKVTNPVIISDVDYENNIITFKWEVDTDATDYDVKVIEGEGDITEDTERVTIDKENGKVTIEEADSEKFYSNVYEVAVKGIGDLGNLLFDSELITASQDNTVMTGAGTEGDPYMIRSSLHFANVFGEGGAQTALAKSKSNYFKQSGDIVINKPYTPQSDGNVVCKYDGAGFSITINNYVPAAGSSINEGLFSTVASGGKISNLTVKGTIDATGEGKVGGIVGQLTSGTISNCTNEATIKGASNVGGIVGVMYNNNATVEFCVNKGAITNTGAAMGGIVGNIYANKYGSSTTINNCANYGTLTNNSSSERISIGGLVGSAGINLIVEKSFNAGAINVVNGSAGALIGSNYSAGDFSIEITDCFNTGVITTSKPEALFSLTAYAKDEINKVLRSS